MYLCLYTPAGEQLERAFHLSLAALLGEGVYNFGELVSCTYIIVIIQGDLISKESIAKEMAIHYCY